MGIQPCASTPLCDREDTGARIVAADNRIDLYSRACFDDCRRRRLLVEAQRPAGWCARRPPCRSAPNRAERRDDDSGAGEVTRCRMQEGLCATDGPVDPPARQCVFTAFEGFAPGLAWSAGVCTSLVSGGWVLRASSDPDEESGGRAALEATFDHPWDCGFDGKHLCSV